MANIKPFRGYRPQPDRAPQVCSPPYDILSSSEARQMAGDNPDSFLRVIKPEIDLPLETDIYADEVYEQGTANLRRLIDSQVLVRDEAPCFYIYRLEAPDHVQTGIMCAASIEEYDQGLIKRHELTRLDRETDRTRMVDAQNGNAGPVFLTYHEAAEITALCARITAAEPEVSFEGRRKIRHSLWPVGDTKSIAQIEDMFKAVPALYIADGHHRALAASRVRALRQAKSDDPQAPWNHFLTIIFPDTQLKILDYNRVVKDLNGLSCREFLTMASELFEIEETGNGRPRCGREFGFYCDGTWHRLTARPGTYPANDPVNGLDVAILHNNIISPILGIHDLKKDARIEFVGGSRGLEELENRVAADCMAAFALFPTTIAQLMDVADEGEIMPPKSTWFYPKPYSGMAVYLFEE